MLLFCLQHHLHDIRVVGSHRGDSFHHINEIGRTAATHRIFVKHIFGHRDFRTARFAHHANAAAHIQHSRQSQFLMLAEDHHFRRPIAHHVHGRRPAGINRVQQKAVVKCLSPQRMIAGVVFLERPHGPVANFKFVCRQQFPQRHDAFRIRHDRQRGQ